MKLRFFDIDAKCKPTRSVLPVRIFGRPCDEGWASVGLAVAERIRIDRIDVCPQAKDLLRVCLSVVAADHAVHRSDSQDGWTREIEMEIPVEDTGLWTSNKYAIEKMLKFLTGDIWTLCFKQARGNVGQDKYEASHYPGNVVSLLSGGADSLVGALDLGFQKREWIAVSQTSSETLVQAKFATSGSACSHIGWTHGVHIPFSKEGSQRARSMGFFAFAVIAAVSTASYHEGERIEIHASENGLISLNPALTEARIGSASTRTTHPCFVGQLQSLLDSIGVNVQLKNMYQHMTKGEMFKDCKVPASLRKLLAQSMSCGKSGRINQHCGRCVPCIIRRAAFKKSGILDSTEYKYGPNSDMNGFLRSDDVRCAYLGSSNHNDMKWIHRSVLPSLFECDICDREALVQVAKRGLQEVNDFLKDAMKCS
jgi:hypothetical protein